MMLKRNFTLHIFVGLALLLGAALPVAKAADEPLTGTWECMAKGTSNGDTPFTLYLVQKGTSIEGSVSASQGEAEITSGTFKGGTLEIHIDTDDEKYVLKANYAKGALSGTWSHEGDTHGPWEGKKQQSSSK